MAEFAQNTAKNASTIYTLFELHYDIHSQLLFEEDFDICSKFCSIHELADELRDPIEIFCHNQLHA